MTKFKAEVARLSLREAGIRIAALEAELQAKTAECESLKAELYPPEPDYEGRFVCSVCGVEQSAYYRQVTEEHLEQHGYTGPRPVCSPCYVKSGPWPRHRNDAAHQPEETP